MTNRSHTILQQYKLAGMAITEHDFTVPLDHRDPTGQTISLFALEIAGSARADADLPWLLFLQGGPGGRGPRPQRATEGWLSRALQTHRVLLLDQRGTGRSTPMTWREAERFGTPSDLARYLEHLRADSIVRDAEHIRAVLSPERPWETLGQSYGGRITMAYLAMAPEGLKACYIAGGTPSLYNSAYQVCSRTIERVEDRIREFYHRYPEDRETVQRLRQVLRDRPLHLPGGDIISLARVRQLGRKLGMTNGFADLHWILMEALASDGQPSDKLVTAVLDMTAYARNPLHPVLIDFNKIEGDEPTAWPGVRVTDERPAFAEDADTMLLTGEFSMPWMFRDIPALRPFADAMEILQAKTDWPTMWDPRQLVANRVPVAAIIYQEDMYVDAEDSLATSAEVPRMGHWVTNQWQHDGLARSGGQVLDRLMKMADDL